MITQLLPHVLAHGIGGVQDLPVPKWLFFWGGAFVLVVSFILLGALWKTPQLEQHAAGRDLGETFGKIVLGPVRIVVDNGRVTLTGWVNNEVDRQVFGNLAKSTLAFQVTNRIKVDGEAPAEDSASPKSVITI